MPFDEPARRRRDYVGGEPIRLADGQAWSLPVVAARVETRIGPAGPAPVAVWLVGDTFDRAFEDRFQRAIDGFLTSPREMLASQPMVDIGTVLLQRNYDLTADECDWLLYRGFWETARTDGRLIARFPEVMTEVMRIGLEEPSAAAGRLTRGLPRATGPRFDVGAN